MLKQLRETAAAALRPLAKKVVTPLLTSQLGDEVGTVRIAKRFAKQWAASAGIYDAPLGSYTPRAPQSGHAAHGHDAQDSANKPASSVSPARAPVGPIEPRGEQREVVLYTTRKHSSCKTARRILDELGVAYSDIDLSDDEAARQALYKETADRTFPQVYIEGTRLGGFDDLVVAREEGRLRDLLYPQAPAGNA